jgi:hypothetical protein
MFSMHRYVVIAFLCVAGSVAAHGQNAILNQDASPDNRCGKKSAGALWTLHNPTVNNAFNPNAAVMTVVLRVIPMDGHPTRTETQFVAPGQTIELGCSAGPGGVTYEIIETK